MRGVKRNPDVVKERDAIVRNWLNGTNAQGRSNLLVIWWLVHRELKRQQAHSEQLHHLTSQHAVDDVVGEVCLRLLRRCGAYDASRGSLSHWAFWMTRSTVSELIKKGNRQRVPPTVQWGAANLTESGQTDPLDRLDEVSWEEEQVCMDREHLEHCLARLKDSEQQLLERYYLDRQTHDTLAETYGISRTTISHRLRIAVRHLRDAYYEE